MSRLRRSAKASPRDQAGLTLIEFLVTAALLAVGLLGVASMQVYGLKSSEESALRTQATLQVQSLAERMRANLTALEAGQYAFTSAPVSPPNCESSACTPAQLAQWDIKQWLDATAAVLPSGTGSASVSSGTYTITVSWSANTLTSGVSAPSSLSFDYRPIPSPEE